MNIIKVLILFIAIAFVPISTLADFSFTTTCNDYGKCSTVFNKNVKQIFKKYEVGNRVLYNQLRGRIIIVPDRRGEAFYVDPNSLAVFPLGFYDNAFKVLLSHGEGVSNANIKKIQAGVLDMHGLDLDSDGLSDKFEDAIGTDVHNFNTDGDVYSDYWEITRGYSPLGSGKYPINYQYAKQQAGKILLQTQNNGEAWYVNPGNGKRYFLGSKFDANDVMRKLSVGLSNSDFNRLIK